MQEPSERFDDFLCAVKEIAAFCDFCTACLDNRLRDKVIVGTRDEEALKQMLQERNLNLVTAVRICRTSETAHADSADLRGSGPATLQKVSQYRKSQGNRQRIDSVKPEHCAWCGEKRHVDRSQCRARGQRCYVCGKVGHFGKVCRSTKRKHTVQGNTKVEKAKVHRLIADVYVNGIRSRPAPRVNVRTTHPTGSASIMGSLTRVLKQQSWDQKSPFPLAFNNNTYTLLLILVCTQRANNP